MTDRGTLEGIREVNLSYCLLVQKLLREDRGSTMLAMGLTAQFADILCGLSLQQIVRLASTDQILCAFRLSDANMLSVLTAPATRTDAGFVPVLARASAEHGGALVLQAAEPIAADF